MKTNMIIRYLAYLWGISLCVACTAPPPETIRYDQGLRKDVVGIPEAPKGCPDLPSLAAPVVSPSPPNPTTNNPQPFRGTAVGAAQVLAYSQAGSSQPAKVNANGSFCIDVDLTPNQSNTITLMGMDANGCPGKLSSPITLVHKSPTHQDAGITTPINVAKSQTVTSKSTPGTGSLSYVTDGDYNSFVELSFWDWDWGGTCDECTWVKVDLGKPYLVSKFIIKWAPGAGSLYATCYSILAATSGSPADPDCSTNTGWTVVHQEASGISVPLAITIKPVTTRYVALQMFENVSSGLTETFQLAELEVWGQDPGATPPLPPDSCK